MISNSHPIWLNVVHLNENNRSDLVIANSGDNSILLLIDYFFQSAARQTNYGPPQGWQSLLVVITDLNNDSFLDIIFNANRCIFVLIGFGDGSFNRETMIMVACDIYPQYMCVGDLNNDGRMDLIVADVKYRCLNIHLRYGNGTFAPMTRYSTGGRFSTTVDSFG